MTTLRLIADDLTGALDTAAEFVGLGGPVPVIGRAPCRPARRQRGARQRHPRARARGGRGGDGRGLAPGLAGAGDRLQEGGQPAARPRRGGARRLPRRAGLAVLHRGARLSLSGPHHPRRRQLLPHRRRRLVARRGPPARCWREAGLQRGAGRSRRSRWRPASRVFDAETRRRPAPRSPRPVARPTAPCCGAAAAGWRRRWPRRPAAGRCAALLQRPVLGLFGSDQPVTAAQLAACGAHRMKLPDGGAAQRRRARAAARAHRRRAGQPRPARTALTAARPPVASTASSAA